MRDHALAAILGASAGGVLPDVGNALGYGRAWHAPLVVIGGGLVWICACYALGVRLRAMGMVKE